MKKIIFAVATATMMSGAIGVASAYDYNNTAAKTAKSTSCVCTGCSCQYCNCSNCNNCCKK